jgi:hypothetical protein
MGYALDSGLYPEVRATLSGVAPRFLTIISSSSSPFYQKTVEASPVG